MRSVDLLFCGYDEIYWEKTLALSKLRSFSTKSVLRRDKSALQMKSLRDEIRLRRNIKDGFNFIKAVRL